MISFYSGNPGSGKSYHLAQICYEKLKYNDVNIIANFDINLDLLALTRIGWIKHRITDMTDGKIKFRKYNSKPLKGRFYRWETTQITVENLYLFAQQHHERRKRSVDAPQTIVIIDESGILFNCRNYSDRLRQKWLEFFAKHRHFNFDFILGCQWDRQVDKQIRCCVEYDYVHRKLKNYQFLGWLFSTLAGGNLFLVCQNWYANKLHIRNSVIRFRPRIAALYDTLHDFASDVDLSDVPPPGVGGVRGPAAPAPDTPTAATNISQQQQPDLRSRWKKILNNEGE